MIGADRVALVGWLWFGVWIGAGNLVGRLVEMPGTGMVLGFLMALATVWFRIRSNRAYRRVRERIGLVTATLAEDIAGMRVVQSYAREPRNQTSFRGINTRYRYFNYKNQTPEYKQTARVQYEELAKRFPDSEEGKAAAARLDELKGAGGAAGR